MAQSGYRSPWGRQVGGASQPTGIPEFRYGFRSVLAFFLGGGCKPPSRGDYAGPRSMAAFWMGGAALNYIPKPERELIAGGEGLPFAKHHEKRPPIDDEEVLDFIRLWVTWNDIE